MCLGLRISLGFRICFVASAARPTTRMLQTQPAVTLPLLHESSQGLSWRRFNVSLGLTYKCGETRSLLRRGNFTLHCLAGSSSELASPGTKQTKPFRRYRLYPMRLGD